MARRDRAGHRDTCQNAAMATVFLVDDHEIVRRGVRELIEATDDLSVVGEAGSAEEALLLIPQQMPDVVVLDVRLPDGSGIDVCRDLHSLHPEIRFLILTAFEEDSALLSAILAGANGFLLKQIRSDVLSEAIRAIAGGRSIIDLADIEAAKSRLRGLASRTDERVKYLTPQELRILEYLAEGLTNRQIADEMFLAEKTVKNYVSSLLSKMGLSRRTEAAVFAVRQQAREDRRQA
jgi:two-component system response regulator DevR